MNKAVFLDRDGTLIKDSHYLKDPEKIEIINGVGHSLHKLKSSGFGVFMHTNQSGITRGYYGMEDVHACNRRMLEMFNLPDDFLMKCASLRKIVLWLMGCMCKPSPNSELEMISRYELPPDQCWMVGDKWLDAETGLNAGMKVALVQTGKPMDGALCEQAKSNAVPIFPSLAECVDHMLDLIDE